MLTFAVVQSCQFKCARSKSCTTAHHLSTESDGNHLATGDALINNNANVDGTGAAFVQSLKQF
jgi:hypothetical protein